MTENETNRQDPEEEQKKKFEILCGVVIAFFAAVLAVTDLGGSKFGDDEIIAHNEKANAYQWYQSKSIKQSLAEGQRDLLKSFLEAGALHGQAAEQTRKTVEKLDREAVRYAKEKKEILLGSAAVGKENWVQDIDGTFGKVVGAKQWEAHAEALGEAGDIFDYATLFLQLCIVLGAIAIVMQIGRMKWVFFVGMVALGIIGTVISVMAYLKAFSAPLGG